MGRAQETLKLARRRRHQIAHAFKELEAGKTSLPEIIMTNPPVYRRVDVWDVLRRAPKMGRAGAQHVCERAKLFPHRKLGSLNEDERIKLVQSLPPRVKFDGRWDWEEG